MTMDQAKQVADRLNRQAGYDERFEATYFSDGSWYVRGYRGFRKKSWIAAK